MSDESRNVAMLKQAYSRWADSRGSSVDHWMSICGDNISFGSIAQGSAQQVNYLTAYSSRDMLKDYFEGLARDWEMLEYVAEHFVAQDDRVVMLGHCTWRFKRNGRVVSTPKADSWRIVDGKAVEFYEYFDTAQLHAAVA